MSDAVVGRPKDAIPRDPGAPITLAILAVGGQGGGVLSGWLLQLAEGQGWRVQTTSVPGVAQRTGATIYYLEMLADARADAVLALMPSPAAVDIIIAAELMEAGRAIQRGLVSPQRTTMIASDHRAYAVLEKVVPGDGSGDESVVLDAARNMSKHFVHANMEAISNRHGTMISAALFGAVAAAGVLPFAREAYEQTIRAGQVGVAASLAAFADAYAVIDRLNAGDDAPAQVESAVPTSAAVPIRPGAGLAGGTRSAREAYTALHRRMRESFAASTHAVLGEGIDAVVDFQDVRYGIEYLDRVEVISKLERDCDASPLTLAAGRYIAQAMVYDDVVRVADLKTRAGRFERIRNDVGAGDQQIVEVTEFMHPRVEEFCALLPVRLGQGLERSPTGIRLVSLILGKGKRVRTDSLRWFIVLYCVAGLRRFRRGTFRHQVEIRHLEQWLETVRTVAIEDLDLAVQVLRCRRLIKGYADTHVRGLSKFDRALAVLPKLQGRSDAAAQLAAVLEAALSDESGDAMDTLVASL